MKTVLITGASSGFGYRMALTFARNGYKVYATTLDLKDTGVKELKSISKEEGFNISWFEIDVTNQQQVNRVIKELDGVCIDILINNAGYGALGPIERHSVNEVAHQMDVNYVGITRMVYAFLPNLKKSSSATVINISSIAGFMVLPSYGLYSASKHAVVAFSEALRYELKDQNIKVSIIEPAGFDTNFSNNSTGLKEKEVSEDSYGWYDSFLEKRNMVIGNGVDIVSPKRDPQRVADLAYKISEKKSPRFRYLIGHGVFTIYSLRKILPQKLWEAVVGIIISYGKKRSS